MGNYGPHRFYKGHYIIVFYDKTDERLKHIFDNVRDILNFQKKEVNRQNVNIINQEIYKALKSEHHFVTFLTGELMRLYIVDCDDDEDEEYEQQAH